MKDKIIYAMLLVIFLFACTPVNKVDSSNETLTNNNTNVTSNINTSIGNLPDIKTDNATDNKTVKINESTELNSTINNTTIINKPNENKSQTNDTEINPEDPKPKPTSGTGTVITDEPPEDEDTTFVETLSITKEVFNEYYNWYQCRGSCQFNCKSRDQTLLNADIEESGYCICKCSSNNEYLSSDFNEVTAEIIEDNGESVKVEYSKTS